jgi:hypothetical protein
LFAFVRTGCLHHSLSSPLYERSFAAMYSREEPAQGRRRLSGSSCRITGVPD